MKRKPDVVELDVEQLESALDNIERVMGEETARPFRRLLGWYLSLLQLIDKKNISISRLRQLLFGARTERTRDVLPPDGSRHEATEPTDEAADSSTQATTGG